jgi:hypothetical protein
MSWAITRLGVQSEARECIAPNSEATLHRTQLPLRGVKLENALLKTMKARESTAPSKRRYSLLYEARESIAPSKRRYSLLDAARERTAPSKRRYSLLDEAREYTAPNSEATLYRS